MSSPDSKNEESQKKNSSPEMIKNNQMTLSPKPTNNISNIAKLQLNNNINNQILSPKNSNEKIELNTKFYPSKANVCKGEFDNNYYSPRQSNSPIVNYYAGMGHPNSNNDMFGYYSPEEEYNKKDIYNNYNFNTNNQYSNFNFSPSAIFDFGIKGRDSNSSLNNPNGNNYGNFNNIGTTLQEKIEGNLEKMRSKEIYKKYDSGRNSNNPNNSSSGNSGEDEGEENKDLFLLNFNSDDEQNENDENLNNNKSDKIDRDDNNGIVNTIEGNQFTLNISDDDEKNSPLYYNNLNKNNKFNIYSNNFDIAKKPLIGFNEGFIPPPTNMTNKDKFNPQNNEEDNFTDNNNNQNKINENENESSSNNNKQEPTINYYSNYFNNFYFNGEQYKKFPSIGAKFPSYNQDLFKNIENKTNQNESKNIEETVRKIPSVIPRTSNLNKPRPITSQDLITTITSNNKKIKRIDPNIYINENYEYLAYNIFPLAKDQAGCRFLQKKIEDEPVESSKYFYPAILPYISSLVKDPFGNYLIQKLCPTLKPEQIKRILMILSTNILDIGSNSHGTRVIQNLINYLSTNELIDYFITIIRPSVVPLLKELNGTHIIQKLINDFPSYSPKIHKIIIDNCASLATHRHGCCVLQKYLDGNDKELQKKLIDGLIENSLVLIIDQFGNYVIQSMLLLCDAKASEKLVDKLIGNITYYSKHKYSSNVVEKCFDYSDAPARKKLIDALNHKDIICDLIVDEHGNYVIQKVLANANSKTQNDVLNIIIESIPKIKEVSFGEKIINRLLMTYPQMVNMMNLKGNTNYNIKNNGNWKGNNGNRGKYNKKKNYNRENNNNRDNNNRDNNNRDNNNRDNNNRDNKDNGGEKQNQKNYYK